MFLRWILAGRTKRPTTAPLLYRTILVFVLIFPAWERSLAYQDIAIGLAAVEEGDDRQRPALQLYSTLGQDGYVTATHYGRKFAQVEEKSYLINLGARSSIINKQIYACLGGSALLEQTVVNPLGNEPRRQEDNAYNFGVTFALQYEHAWQRVFMRGAWETSLFLAGEAGILLATARKQAISISVGTRL